MNSIIDNHLNGIKTAFWILFILIPLSTGILAYHWLPNESPDESKDTILAAEPRGEGEFITVWQNNETGKTYSRDDFAWHRKNEANRMAIVWFLWGLLGCFFYGYSRNKSGNEFHMPFYVAIIVNIIITAYTYFTIRSP